MDDKKLYSRIDDMPKLGSDFSDCGIFPSIVEEATTRIKKQQEEYVMQKLFDLNIDPNTLANQLNEIYRLNEVVDRLEKALYIACAIIDGNFGTCPLGQFDIELSQCENNCEDNSVCCWKEWLLKEVQEDE